MTKDTIQIELLFSSRNKFALAGYQTIGFVLNACDFAKALEPNIQLAHAALLLCTGENIDVSQVV